MGFQDVRENAPLSDSDAILLHEMYRDMLRIRLIEEAIAREYPAQEMRCPVHLSIGQEAPAVGVCAALRESDKVMSGHRAHAHYLAKGGDLRAMLAEIYGRAPGCAGGNGGSMHLLDLDAGFLGATPIVGSTIPIAAGAAFAAKLRRSDEVVVVFFGDGAVETGVFHESLNFAALHRLPVVFVCENNLYSVYSPLSVRQPDGRTITELVAAHGIEAHRADGNDVLRVREIATKAVETARGGEGPVFLELLTYRWREHCGPEYDNDLGYRTEDEFLRWQGDDPVSRAKTELLGHEFVTEQDLAADAQLIEKEIAEAFASAKAAPFPDWQTMSSLEVAP